MSLVLLEPLFLPLMGLLCRLRWILIELEPLLLYSFLKEQGRTLFWRVLLPCLPCLFPGLIVTD